MLAAGALAGARLELTVTRPMTKATLMRTSIAAVTRRMRRPCPVVWTGVGAVVEEIVMVRPFSLLSQFGSPAWVARMRSAANRAVSSL